MKDYERVRKYVKTNRRDMEDVTDENLARELYKFFYGKDCNTCKFEKNREYVTPCNTCENANNWSPK